VIRACGRKCVWYDVVNYWLEIQRRWNAHCMGVPHPAQLQPAKPPAFRTKYSHADTRCWLVKNSRNLLALSCTDHTGAFTARRRKRTGRNKPVDVITILWTRSVKFFHETDLVVMVTKMTTKTWEVANNKIWYDFFIHETLCTVAYKNSTKKTITSLCVIGKNDQNWCFSAYTRYCFVGMTNLTTSSTERTHVY